MSINWANYLSYIPHTYLLVCGVIFILIESVSRRVNASAGAIKYLSMLSAIFLPFVSSYVEGVTGVGGLMLITVFFAIGYIVSVLASSAFVDKFFDRKGEFYILMYFVIFGLLFVVTAQDFFVFFTGFETASVALYLLVGYQKNLITSIEASIKYFISGMVASGVMVYGFSFMVSYSLSASFVDIAKTIATFNQAGGGFDMVPVDFKFGLALFIVGFLFKIAAAPFHMWAIDTYTGASTVAVGFVSTLPKIAVIFLFSVLSLFFGYNSFPAVFESYYHLIEIVAIFSMIVGNVVALVQTNLKRILAYSSVANAGYMLVAISGYSQMLGIEYYNFNIFNIAYFGIVYIFMTMGVFAILTALETAGYSMEVASLRGLHKSSPFAAASLTVFMLSFAGIPPLGGFTAKFFLFGHLAAAGNVSIVVVALILSAVSCAYYLKPIYYMYFSEDYVFGSAVHASGGATATKTYGASNSNVPQLSMSTDSVIAVVICLIIVIAAGFVRFI